MNVQLEFDLSTPTAPPRTPAPLGMRRVNGRLQFSDHPDNFAAELAAIVADEQRLHAEQRTAS